jgi:hypothetical protein
MLAPVLYACYGVTSSYYSHAPGDYTVPLALDRAAFEYPQCPTNRVASSPIAGNVVRLDVCGRTVVYSCDRGVCVHDSWDGPEPGRPAP